MTDKSKKYGYGTMSAAILQAAVREYADDAEAREFFENVHQDGFDASYARCSVDGAVEEGYIVKNEDGTFSFTDLDIADFARDVL